MESQKGSFTVILACLLGFVAVVGGIYFIYGGGPHDGGAGQNLQAAFEEWKSRVEEAMGQPSTLSASVERNPNAFACLTTATAECRGKGGLFLLYKGAQPLSQLMFDAGVTASGEACRGFPSPACPLRVEANWTPVCNGSYCENTKSARVLVRVLLDEGRGGAQEWKKEGLFTPSVTLSQAVACERGGGVWAGECLTHEQAAQRQIASRTGGDLDLVAEEREQSERERQETPSALPEVTCPDMLTIQGQEYPLEFVGPARAVARTPAMNGCPGEDIFTFQCQSRGPEEREGMWVQVESQMAPLCDEQGQALNEAVHSGEAPRDPNDLRQ